MGTGVTMKSRLSPVFVLGFLACCLIIIFGTSQAWAHGDRKTETPNRDVTIFEAKSIITMEDALPRARFVAIADGIILGVANDIESLSLWSKNSNVTVNRQFADQILMPGFVEPHIHPMQAILMLSIPFISPESWHLPHAQYPAASNDQDYRTLLEKELKRSNDPMFISWGYHNLFHGPLNKEMLDEIAPDRPVVIWQRSFHEVIANSLALEQFGMGDKANFDAEVQATGANADHAHFEQGTIGETALLLAVEKMRPHLLTPVKIADGLRLFKTMLEQNGVTTTADLAFGNFAGAETEAGLFASVFKGPDSYARISLITVGHLIQGDPDIWRQNMEQKFGINSNMLFPRRIKLFADGAFFAQYMQMNPPGYSDGHKGVWLTEPADLAVLNQRYWNAGWSIHTHVNGDKGLDTVFDIYTKLSARYGQDYVLEHLGYSTETQNARIAQYGMMVSAQPNYIRILGDAYARSGLGPDRAAQMSRLGSLERKSVTLGLHSDFNMAPINPLYLAWVATNRTTLEGNIKAPTERLSVGKAMRAITIDAARIIGMESEVGSIASGKKADFVVLEQDPFAANVNQLNEIAVKGIIFEGKVKENISHSKNTRPAKSTIN